jgi:hypothetical protein
VRDIKGIGHLSVALAAYEVYASARHKRPITHLSHQWPWSLLVWGWVFGLIWHFLYWSFRDVDSN